jgi:hypothetical protein
VMWVAYIDCHATGELWRQLKHIATGGDMPGL